MIATSAGTSRQHPAQFGHNSGVSRDAERLGEESDEIKQSFARTNSFGERLSQIIEAVLKLKEQYSEDNWDGYGAGAIDELSFKNSLRFVLSLPISVPVPELDVIPAGQVVFTWYLGKRRVFSVILGSSNELSYAGLFGAVKTYGVEYFSDGIPETILTNIDKVYR